MDVLGVQENLTKQDGVYDDFKDQLVRTKDGWYETGLLWKIGHPPLQNNKSASLGRLSKMVVKLNRNPLLLRQYDEIIREQLRQGIVELAPETESGKRVFYLPHRPVIRENAESTKLRIVFDGSARPDSSSPSLNDCLETGPALQNMIWDILVRNRMRPVAFTCDLKQAFLQVRIREEDRDALRFHWLDDLHSKRIMTLRFTRAMFGLVQSPFLLGGTVEQHLARYKDGPHSEVAAEIGKCVYVDDIIGGGDTAQDCLHFQNSAIAIFKEAGFLLHKWHSNVPHLEWGSEIQHEEEPSFAKQQLGVGSGESKILGLSWKKFNDIFSFSFTNDAEGRTKRDVLQHLASMYDPLGFASPVSLVGKNIFRRICEQKVSWDVDLPAELLEDWKIYIKGLTIVLQVKRAIPEFQEEVKTIELHAFGDASQIGTCAVLYAVVHQPSGINQGIVAARSRLARKETTIPRLELVASHMAANLLENAVRALSGMPIQRVCAWTDSTTVLHWIRGEGRYKQFVRNRVNYIRGKDFIE